MKPPTKIERLLRILEKESASLVWRMGNCDCRHCKCGIHRGDVQTLAGRVRRRFEKEEKARKEQSR